MSKSTDNMKKDKDLGNASSSAATPKSTSASTDLKNRFEDINQNYATLVKKRLNKGSKAEKDTAELQEFFDRITESELKALEEAASNNDAIAQYKVGMYYLDLLHKARTPVLKFPKADGGFIRFFPLKAIIQNKKEAFTKAIINLMLAANQEVPAALFVLGQTYLGDMNEPKAVQQAFEFQKKAAELGYDIAQFNLGQAYRNGLTIKNTVIVEKNPEKAFDNYLEAAKQGQIASQNNLAYCYVKGFGTPKDNTKALFWLTKAWGAEEAASILKSMTIEHSKKATVEENTAPSTTPAASSASSAITVSTVASSTQKRHKK